MATQIQEQMAITAIGMVSALGLDVGTTCAALRAGLTRAAPFDGFSVYSREDWGHVGIVAHGIHDFADGYEGVGKILRLASGGLADLLAHSDLVGMDLQRTGLVLILSSFYHEAAHADALAIETGAKDTNTGQMLARARQSMVRQALLNAIGDLSGLNIPQSNILTLFNDAPGAALALREAGKMLTLGRFDQLIVGGVDSLLDAKLLEAALHFNLLKASGNPMGFQPGEAAAFILIETVDAARRRRVPIKAVITAATMAKEPCHRLSNSVSTGEALAEAVGEALALATAAGVCPGFMVCNLNGDAAHAWEWGAAMIRLRPKFPKIGTWPLWLPGSAIGETGAAAGIVAACVACRAFSRSYAPSDHALIWLVADSGTTGAFCLSRQ